jgi:hypothetical protein
MRSAARSWMADNGVEFELAEACLAHAIGNAVVQAYQRSSMIERQTDHERVGVVPVGRSRRQRGRSSKGRGMIPVEVIQTPGHYTTFWDWLDHWQSLAAGFVALLVALFAVFEGHGQARRELQRVGHEIPGYGATIWVGTARQSG